MRRPKPLTALLLVLVATIVLRAEDGRDFAGFFTLSDVTDLGEEFRVTLTLRVYNYSGADVTDATITLDDSMGTDASYGSFPNVSILYRESSRLSGQFTIPRREYDLWQKGATPQLRIHCTAPGGPSTERIIELAPGLGEEE